MDVTEMNEQNEAYVAISDEHSDSSNLTENLIISNSQSIAEGNGSNRERTQRKRGHDEVFVTLGSTDYECSVCMLVMRNPVQTPCGHKFCASCIKHLIRYLKLCVHRVVSSALFSFVLVCVLGELENKYIRAE